MEAAFLKPFYVFLSDSQVMETDKMIYLVTEYANRGEIFGKLKEKKMGGHVLYNVRNHGFTRFFFPLSFSQIIWCRTAA